MRKPLITLLILSLVLISCKKRDIIEPRNSQPSLYFEAVIDGTATYMGAGNEGYRQTATRVDNTDGRFWRSRMIPGPSGGPSLTIEISNHVFPAQDSIDDLEKSIIPGVINFAHILNPLPGTRLATLYYADDSNLYRSNMINQQSRTFEIKSVKDTLFEGTRFKIAHMEFSALLLPVFGTDTLRIEKAKARMVFANPF